MSRPEEQAPPEIFYNAHESTKYHNNSRIQAIQAQMSVRALELLALECPSLVLDVGCGSGLSGECIWEEGHVWVGMDISGDMLAVALDRAAQGDMLLADMGDGVPFRAGTFDAVLSISALQWLCNADTSTAEPRHRLARFFATLYASLKRGGKVVAQFYPSSEKQTDLIVSAAHRAGFGGGVVIDNPDSKKARKFYICLVAGPTSESLNFEGVAMPQAKANNRRAAPPVKGSREWIRQKKEVLKKKGRVVKRDSKFTGRSRGPRF